jgi:hypothetical protein
MLDKKTLRIVAFSPWIADRASAVPSRSLLIKAAADNNVEVTAAEALLCSACAQEKRHFVSLASIVGFKRTTATGQR